MNLRSRVVGNNVICKYIVLLALAAAVPLLSSCGGGSSTTTTGTVSITISPTSATLAINNSQQFSATVTNSSNTNVTWQVNGTTGGNSIYGAITTSGLYTAPASVPSTAVTVTAISQADTTKTATATIAISNTNSLTVSPSLATVSSGGQQTFSALLGENRVDANWSLSCGSTVIGACGTISSSGIYTAPLSPPLGQNVFVIATSRNNSASSANSTITVTLSTGTLYGQYGFLLSGDNAGQRFAEVGSVSFDGKGNITGGSIDRLGVLSTVPITGGSYSSDSDGRVKATIHTDSGDESWQIILINHSRAVAIRSDTVVARGDLDLQDSSKFGQTLTGFYGFHLAGSSKSSTISVSAIVGAMNINANGNFSSGLLDANDGGVVYSKVDTSGALSASSLASGRGTLSIASDYGTLNFVYYLVDSNSAKLMEVDASHDYVGKLASRISSTSVDTSSFVGTYAFVFSGANKDGTLGHGGTFQVFPAGVISNGTLDISTDSVFGLGNLFNGTLAVTDSTTGRSTITLNVNGSALQYVAYAPDTDFNLNLLEVDDKNIMSGPAMRFGTVYSGSLPTLSGQFAMTAGEVTGSVKRVGAGTLALPTPSGTFDLNDGGTVTLGSPLQYGTFTALNVYGRSQFQFQAGNFKPSFTSYEVDNNTALVLETDGKGVLTGTIEKRY